MPFTPYLDSTTLANESAWYYTNWAPVLTPSTFTTYLTAVCTRVGRHIQWRVGADDYATSDAGLQAILLEMELTLAQYYLCCAAGAIASSSEDPLQNPIAGAGVHLLGSAEAYKGRCEELLGWWGAHAKRTWSEPAADAGPITPEALPQFDATVDWGRSG